MMIKTKHAVNCNKVFGRKDPTCPRCIELLNGAPPRKGWNYYKLQDEARRIEAINSHDCKKSGCGPICTAFDW